MDDLARIKSTLDQADFVLIGASNGLDMAEGLNISGDDRHFREAYADLAATCGARGILDGMWRARCDEAAAWAWLARFAMEEWLGYEPSPLMRALERLTAGKDRFVVTCNTDGRFARAGFDAARVLETERSVRELVCPSGCGHREPSEPVVRAAVASIRNGRVDLASVPRCPACGARLKLGIDEVLAQRPDAVFRTRLETLQDLVQTHRVGRACVLELGVGLRNGLVKRILASTAAQFQYPMYAVFNYSQVVRPAGLTCEFAAVEGDMARAFAQMEGPDAC